MLHDPIPKQLIAVHPSGAIDVTVIAELPSLEDLSKVVGGYIELVPYFFRYNDLPCVAFCNEYGKQNKLEPNPTATLMWMKACRQPALNDHLVGSVAIVTGPTTWLAKM